MTTHIDFISYFVKDLPTMVKFYHEVLGFDTDWDGQGPFAEFQNAGIRIGMFERAQLPNLLGQTPDYTHGINGTFEIAIDLPTSADADKMYAAVVKAGAKSIYPPRDEPWGQHASLIADPEGNLVEIGSWNKGK
jgi:lactoylglutathione lyase